MGDYMYDVIIIGAGVSGLMAASLIKNKKVLILEKTNSSGKKLLLTGNGRCNITNLKENRLFLDNVNYNKKYLYSTINLFGAKEVFEYFKSIKLKIEDDDKVFPCSDKASDILNCLMSKIKCKINYNEQVIDIKIDENIMITTTKQKYIAKKIIIATGGSSYKVTGSGGDHIKFCKMLNQPYIELFPAETSIILKEKNNLAGTSFDNVHIKKFKNHGNLMYTHKGLSGTAIMNISGEIYLNKIKDVYIDFKPEITSDEILKLLDKEKFVLTVLNEWFSKKFSEYLLNKLNISNCKIKQLDNKKIKNLIELIKNHHYIIDKVNEIDYAYVTGGGVNLKYIDTKTFESKINKNVYFIGECLDIHGPIGGYNITLALSTAYSCIKHLDIES